MTPKLKFNKKQYDKFELLFGLNLNNYIEAMLSLQTGKAIFAIIRFDDYMSKCLGYDIKKSGLSLKQFLKKRYGKDAVSLIEELVYN